MVTVRAHFDGKVIIPDEPVALPADRQLLVDISYRESLAELGQRIALGDELDLCDAGTDEFLEEVAASRAADSRRVEDTPHDGLNWPFLRAAE